MVTRVGLRQISTTLLHCPTPKTPTLVQTSCISLKMHAAEDVESGCCSAGTLGQPVLDCMWFLNPHHTWDTLDPLTGPSNAGKIWMKYNGHSGSEQAGQHLCETRPHYGLWGGRPSRRRRLSSPALTDVLLNGVCCVYVVDWLNLRFSVCVCCLYL